MPLPVGVETRTIRLTVPLDTLGNLPKVYAGVVMPDRALVWAATGDRLWPAGAKLPDPVGGFVDFDVPIVDQDGWVDKQGDPITGWSYRLVVTGTWEVKARTVVRDFQVLEASPGVVDIEILPEGPVLPALNPGDGYVSSVLGHTGPITGAQLIDALKDRFDRKTKWHPEDFGDGAPGYPNDDAPAILQAVAAAAAFGGSVELQGGKTYGASGDLLVKNGVSIRGAGANAYGNGNSSRIKATDATFRFRWGSASAGGANFPAEVRDVVIDGDGIAGAGHELFRFEAVDSTLDNVVVINSAGDGMVGHNAQNNTILNPRVDNCPNGTAYKIQNNDEAMFAGAPFDGQAGGHNVVLGAHFTRSLRLFHFDYEDVSGGVLNFWPHDNLFFGSIFEQYQDDVDLLGRVSDGEVRFSHCTFTGSSGMLTVTEDCLILAENQIRPGLPVTVTFDSCDFGGGALGVSDIIRTKSYGAAIAVRFYGKTSVANANRGYFLCDDRGPGGGLGVVGGLHGPIDGLTTSDVSIGALGAAAATNTLPVTSGYADLVVGQKVHVIDVETKAYLAEARTITAKLVGPDRITINGAPITTTAGDYLTQIGVRLSRGLNGGSGGSFVTTLQQPVRRVMDATQGRPDQWRRLGDVTNRGSIDRDFGMRWGNGVDSSTTASIVNAGTGLLISGENVMQVAAFTTATRPAAANAFYVHHLILDTDTGEILWSDGAAWRSVATVSGVGGQPLDSDLTAIAALTTTTYGRALLTLADQAGLMALLLAATTGAQGIVELATSAETIAGTDAVRAVTPAGLAATSQPLDSDLTAVAALATTPYGRALLTLANQAALVALLPSYQPLDGDLTNIAALATVIYGRSLLTLSSATALTNEILAATESLAGRIEIATQTETNTGTDDVRAITPLKLAVRLAAYAQPLDSDLTSMAALSTTPFGRALLTLADAAALAASVAAATTSAQGAVELSTDAEAITGTDTGRAVTPSNLSAVRAGLGHIERSADGTQTGGSGITSGGAAQTVLWQSSVVAGRGGVTYSAGVFTIGTAGTYAITVYVGLAANAAGRRQLVLRRTTTAPVTTTIGALVTPAPAAGAWLASAGANVDCAAGDTIDVQVFQDSASTLGVTQGFITIHRVA